MKTLLLILLCSVACAQTIQVGSGLNISTGPTTVVALTNELGIRFTGGPSDGTTITIGTVASVITTNVDYGHNAPFVEARGVQPMTHRGTNMTERWWVTNVIETHTLRFMWRGRERILTDDVTISSTTNHQILRYRWMPKEPNTNWPPTPTTITQQVDIHKKGL